MRKAGAKEIHVRISCPPHRYPCYYGIDFQQKGELIAADHTLEEIRQFLNVESLRYLSVDGMMNCATQPREHFCNACFTKDYPTPIEEETKKLIERKIVREVEKVG